MTVLRSIRDSLSGALEGAKLGSDALGKFVGVVDEALNIKDESAIRAQESAEDLELMLENIGWKDLLTQTGDFNFSRENIRRLVDLSRTMYLINPLIRRAVTVQELYVWGGGVKIEAEDELVEEVLDDFFKHRGNQRVIGEAWPEREREQRITGNTFFTFHRNMLNGTARVRVMPVEQVQEIVCNPNDSKEPWFYIRVMPSPGLMQPNSGLVDSPGASQTVWYPDIDYNPEVKMSVAPDGSRVEWSVQVLHVKTGGLSEMRFGLPELYSSLGWATAYKGILENFATVLRAYARLAMKISGAGSKKNIAASKAKLNTTISSGSRETNPSANTAAMFISSGGMDITPIKTAGHTTGPDEARALRSMVASGSDTPEHFFGDSDIGNFATSTTLDRPTELKMVSRQQMWANIILHICEKLMEWSSVSPKGKMRTAGFRGLLVPDPFDGSLSVMITPPEDSSTKLDIKFPNIIERDVVDRVRSIVMAATLNGSSAEGIIPNRGYLFELLMTALGEKDAESLRKKFYPDDVVQGFVDPGEAAENDRIEAKAKADLGTAAIQQAEVAKVNAEKPEPKSSVPLPAASASRK